MGTYAISGTKDLPGWEKNKDGEQISGFTFFNNTGKYYVVKPDAFSAAAADCLRRENWRLAMCTTKYGNVGGLFKVNDTISLNSIENIYKNTTKWEKYESAMYLNT